MTTSRYSAEYSKVAEASIRLRILKDGESTIRNSVAVVAEASIRLRILKVSFQCSSIIVLRGGRGIDPLEDTERIVQGKRAYWHERGRGIDPLEDTESQGWSHVRALRIIVWQRHRSA